MKKERATELEYLRWFYQTVDLGPAESDIRDSLNQLFKKETEKLLPEGYNYNSEGFIED